MNNVINLETKKELKEQEENKNIENAKIARDIILNALPNAEGTAKENMQETLKELNEIIEDKA